MLRREGHSLYSYKKKLKKTPFFFLNLCFCPLRHTQPAPPYRTSTLRGPYYVSGTDACPCDVSPPGTARRADRILIFFRPREHQSDFRADGFIDLDDGQYALPRPLAGNRGFPHHIRAGRGRAWAALMPSAAARRRFLNRVPRRARQNGQNRILERSLFPRLEGANYFFPTPARSARPGHVPGGPADRGECSGVTYRPRYRGFLEGLLRGGVNFLEHVEGRAGFRGQDRVDDRPTDYRCGPHMW